MKKFFFLSFVSDPDEHHSPGPRELRVSIALLGGWQQHHYIKKCF